MQRILLGLVLFVFYFIQAEDDFEKRGLTFPSEIQTELDGIKNESERRQMRAFYIEVFNMGYKDGYSSAKRIPNFIRSFQCAINSVKPILEDCYKTGQVILPFGEKYENPVLPSDIINLIKNNDEWVRLYDLENYLDPANNLFDKNAATDIDNGKLMPIDKYEAKIKKSFQTWYNIINLKISENLMPINLKNLQAALEIFHKENSRDKKYKTIDDVKVRFAAHMARSFRMMYVLHNPLNNILLHDAEQNPKIDFLTLLLKYAPNWHMSQEQYQFLNIVRQVTPLKLTSLSYVNVQNKKDEWVVLPYDHTLDSCGRLIINKLPTPPNNLYTPISIVFDKYSSKPLPMY